MAILPASCYPAKNIKLLKSLPSNIEGEMVADASSCWRSRAERGFSGNKGLHARSGVAASCEPARNTARSEGSLRSKPVPAVAFLCFLSLAKQRKRGLRMRTSFCGVKTKPSLEGFVLTKLKQDLCKRVCFYAAKRVPAPARGAKVNRVRPRESPGNYKD